MDIVLSFEILEIEGEIVEYASELVRGGGIIRGVLSDGGENKLDSRVADEAVERTLAASVDLRRPFEESVVENESKAE